MELDVMRIECCHVWRYFMGEKFERARKQKADSSLAKMRRIRNDNKECRKSGAAFRSRDVATGRLTGARRIRYAGAFLDRGAEAISSRARSSEQLRRPVRKGREIYSAEVFAVSCPAKVGGPG